MSSTVNSLVAEQHQTDLPRPGEHRRRHGATRPRRDSAFTRWVSMSHSALNQAKLAAPRPASSSSVPCSS